jgi:hypothetical protein
MKKQSPQKRNQLRNEKGMAIIEVIPLIVIFLMFLSFGMGMWGAIHTATLHSIGARAYAFETFRQRTNLYYFREDRSGMTQPYWLGIKGFRYHAIQNEDNKPGTFVATTRNIAMGTIEPTTAGTTTIHNQDIFSLQTRNQKTETTPMWVMVGYGLCLNADCGGSGN